MKKRRRQRVVIVGTGFAGVYAYLSLHRHLHGKGAVEIVIVSESDSFTFIPVIHEVATGLLPPSSISQPVRTLPQCCVTDFVEGEVTHVDADKNRITIFKKELDGAKESPSQVELFYDYLVLAHGSETAFFGVPGAEEHSLQLKNLADAKRIRNHVIDVFEAAQQTHDPEKQRDILTFVVVGGGPTGVEIVGELADLFNKEIKAAFPDVASLARIIIVERGSRVLKKGVSEWFGEQAERVLKEKPGVYFMYNTSVSAVTEEGVETDNGTVRAGTVIWSAGVKARYIDVNGEKDVLYEEKTGRIKVNDFLQIPSYKNIYVIGDAAWICDAETSQPYPMRAQFAVREGKQAGKNIAAILFGKRLERFAFRERGLIISLGKGGSLTEMFGIHFKGSVGWFLYRSAYLLSIVGFRAKVRTALEWLLNLFLPRDISRL